MSLKGFGKWLKGFGKWMAPFLVAATFTGIACIITVNVAYDGEVSLAQYPQLSAPLVALFIAIASLIHFAFEERTLPMFISCFILFLFASTICILLSLPAEVVEHKLWHRMVPSIGLTHWMVHLGLVSMLYFSFITWDVITYACIAKNETVKREILQGTKFLNLPTLLAFLVMWFYLDKTHSVEPDTWLFAEDGAPRIWETARDVFIAGLVSFHITVGAIVYMISALPFSENAVAERQET